jgi:hypothetical protein
MTNKNTNNKKRSFLKNIAYAGLAGWLLFPSIANMLHLGSTIAGTGQSATAALKKISHKLHPEIDILYLTLRNAVIAEKLSYLAKSFAKRPHIAIVLGAGHVGIEDMLTSSSARRLKYLSQKKYLIRKLAKADYLHKATTINFTGKTWGSTRTNSIDTLKPMLD